jgi:hypothetical protein
MSCLSSFRTLSLLASVFGVALAACADREDLVAPGARLGTSVEERVPADAGVDAPITAESLEIVAGVPSRGRDPAVVALAMADGGLCSGTLVADRVVLTARHCIAETTEQVSCPPTAIQVGKTKAPKDVLVLAGDDTRGARVLGRGAAIVAPDGPVLCNADIAFVVLDASVKGIRPVPLRPTGARRGEFVRAVGFGRAGDGLAAGTKLVREHVEVIATTAAEFLVGEATCQGDSGGPAIDEDTGEVIGVVSRGGPSCEGAGVHNVYTRVDPYFWLFDEALQRATVLAGVTGPTDPPKTGTKSKPPTDTGGACEVPADCASGICILDDRTKYCSRGCGTGDRCPNGFHCKAVSGSNTKLCTRAS